MMARFDPARARTGFSKKMLDHYVGAGPERYLPNAVGNAAAQGVQNVIKAYLVGLHREIQPVLVKYRGWFEDSIARDERFGESPEFQAKIRNQSHGLCLWLLGNVNAPDIFRDAVAQEELSWAKNWRDGNPATSEDILRYMGDYLANCIQSGEYQRGAEMYERVATSLPTSFEKVTSPTAFGYLICRARAEGEIVSNERLMVAANRVLVRHLESDWLAHGQFTRAAAWLKIILWHPESDHFPLDTILRAYDFMPNVTRPEFVANSASA